MNTELLDHIRITYFSTADPNRLPGGQTVQPWPEHVRNLHNACKQYLLTESKNQ